MKRFWKEVTLAPVDGGWRVLLDGRPLNTQGGRAQVVPNATMAAALAEEWRAQPGEVDPRGFPLRGLADLAIDHVTPDRADAVAKLLAYAETDTLCYRADPDEPLYRRQQAMWEPLTAAAERGHGIKLERVSGVVHRPQPSATLERLRAVLEEQDAFTLAALSALAPLAASLTVALAAVERDADAVGLFAAANCEQDWQAEQWGWEREAENDRARRLTAFEAAVHFARLAKS